ncbi:MAG: SprT family zinc-dependent metalloprotease [Pseudomonadota bacterium]|nr:SprT family zinc-dependent metalloprotease [Pseudomonadota bacterium]
MTAIEQSTVQFGRTSIPYAIERGRRHKTVAITVDPERGVRVRAPRYTPIIKLDDIVRRKAKWIIDRRRQHEDLPPQPTEREFVNGETFLYTGKQYRLKLVRHVKGENAPVRLVAGRLYVSASRQPREVLIDWYRGRAQQRLVARVQVWAERIGVSPAGVLVREQRTRWGSADAKGYLRFNWRIVQASTRLLDYVVAHELVHLLHADHTREFWAMLGRVMPDYEARREKLRVVGRAMVW